ncbi:MULTISPECIES: sensor histidine kinase [Streptosporangium]|uniref:histidine kinase n=1 Tax=Streptosporangium brasiliense TaxID=47480 RepID=A0ABT9QYG3_9ACTN|nr:histidine kinase [Streptosporangium brasiliense]MDP9861711.1 signal transduction histidine kinase [Streptosporangium brasiliense]
MTEYRWLLPAVLHGDPGEGQPGVRRSTRDWAVDMFVFLGAAGTGLLMALALRSDTSTPQPILLADQVVGALACAAVWLRRRWPVGLALALLPVSLLSSVATGPVCVALFTVAVHRPLKFAALTGGLHLLTLAPYLCWRPDPELPFWVEFTVAALLYVLLVIWGMFVRARRQLVLTLRERAERAEVEAELRVERARHLERERIAREMHDVLAHRLSLLSVHAGALEYRPDMEPHDVARTAGVIRAGAHQALQDLREVIGVLRIAPEGTTPDRPQPTLADLTGLVEESRLAGMEVTLDMRVSDPAEAPARLGRNAYRITQEGLTNARKHAADAPVGVTVAGGPGDGLTVEIRNPVTVGQAIPGSGSGLIGLTERAELMGGRLDYGRGPDGRFRLRAWLPWAA